MTESHGQTRAAGKVLPLRRGAPGISSEGRERYLAHIDARLAEANEPARVAARADFARLAFPTTKQELWKYTPLSPIARVDYAPARHVEDASLDAQALERRFGITLPSSSLGPLLVLVNGRLSPSLSALAKLPAGITVQSLSEAARAGHPAAAMLGSIALASEHAFVALSAALWTEGVLIHLGRGARLDRPLTVVHVTLPVGVETVAELSADAVTTSHAQASYPRVLVVAEDESVGSLVESYVGVAANGTSGASAGSGGSVPSSFTSAVTEIALGARSRFTRVALLREPGLHLGVTEVRQGASSRFVSSVFSLSGELARAEVNVRLAEQGAECVLDGLYLGGGSEHHDHQTLIDHLVPRCTSAELYKGVLGGKSSAVFHGRVHVKPDAQKTASSQSNKTLLLSPNAVINTKPGLEIFADDVKATHGAAIGQLDAAQLFYLRARGVGVTEGRQMLTHAFAREVVDRLEDEPLRQHVDALVQSRLLALATEGEPTP